MANAWTAASLTPTIKPPKLNDPLLATRSLPPGLTTSATPDQNSNLDSTGLASILAAVLGAGQQNRQSTQAENMAALGYASDLGARGQAILTPGNILTSLTGTPDRNGRFSGGLIENLAINNPWANYGGPSLESAGSIAPFSQFFPGLRADTQRYNLLNDVLFRPNAVGQTSAAAAGANVYSPFSSAAGGNSMAPPVVATPGGGTQRNVTPTWGANQALSNWNLPPVLG